MVDTTLRVRREPQGYTSEGNLALYCLIRCTKSDVNSFRLDPYGTIPQSFNVQKTACL